MPNRRRWRTLLTPAATGVANMALDEALMERAAATGEWICRIYGWSEPTISFGRHQAAVRHYDAELIKSKGFATVRRPTGGRAILHHREVTYSVAAPVADAGGLHESYLLINRLLVDGLRSLGIDVNVAESRVQAMQPGPIPCFDHPSSGELVAGGRKLVGSAQWRSEKALLQHGSILIDDEQGELTGLLREPGTLPPPPAATLREWASGQVGKWAGTDVDRWAGDVAGAIFSAIAVEDPEVRPLVPDQQLLDSQALLMKQYADPTWTWRR